MKLPSKDRLKEWVTKNWYKPPLYAWLYWVICSSIAVLIFWMKHWNVADRISSNITEFCSAFYQEATTIYSEYPIMTIIFMVVIFSLFHYFVVLGVKCKRRDYW